MDKIQVLDCTLRDGGYCNHWKFGYKNIQSVINGLDEAGIEIIECGFLTDKILYEEGLSKYNIAGQVDELIGSGLHKMFVCMVNYGEYDVAQLPDCRDTRLDGIRIAFHKKDLEGAIEVAGKVKEKGYKVFIQAMVSLNYSDSEFLSLIDRCNQLAPYAFYIVDSFGVMKQKELTRLFYLVEHNLNENINIGFHSHNNLQLAYSNAQALLSFHSERNLIIDSCIFGMGRGAGNLNTELFIDYLNDNYGKAYKLKPILNLIDKIINNFYMENGWGYSLPNYLSAVHNAHPNYAGYMDEKKTLAIENMEDLFSMMEENKKPEFDEVYIRELFERYMNRGKIYDSNRSCLKQKLDSHKLLLIAPGKSSILEKEKILDFVEKNNPITISINFEYSVLDTDYIFVSNLRRFKNLSSELRNKMITTSNISADNVFLEMKYADLVNDNAYVRDNAGLMLIQFLLDLDVGRLWIAGMDGYHHDAKQNFADNDMSFVTKTAVFDAYNQGIQEVLEQYSEAIDITFITQTRFKV